MNNINYIKEIYNLLTIKYPLKTVYINIIKELNYSKVVILKSKIELCDFSVDEKSNELIMSYTFKKISNSKIEILDDGYMDKIINYIIKKLSIYPGGQQIRFMM